MNDKNIQIGFALFELVLKYGLPMAMQLVQELRSSNPAPTAEQIRALANRVPHPDEYET